MSDENLVPSPHFEHSEAVRDLRVNDAAGLGARGWMAQFGVVGVMCFITVGFSIWSVNAMDRQHVDTMRLLNQIHLDDLDERRADREERIRLADKIAEMNKAIEHVVDRLPQPRSSIEKTR